MDHWVVSGVPRATAIVGAHAVRKLGSVAAARQRAGQGGQES